MIKRCVLLATFLILSIAVGGFSARDTHAQEGASLIVLAGSGEGGYAVNAYLPATITVQEGSSVRWDFAWYEPHTITFGTPVSVPIGSTPSPATYNGEGFLTSDMTFGPGASYTITFTQAGTYPYYCLIHPFHKGTVEVIAVGEAGADAQATVDARGQAEYAAALAELRSIADEARAQPIETRDLPDGTTERTVRIARETRYGDVQQFFPPTITVEEGDRVRWRTAARTPHTVTFGPFPTGVPLPGNPVVDGVFRPAETYDGEGYWNSGLLSIDQDKGAEFSLTFTTEGTFAYYCILHANQGHVGTVEVVARGQLDPGPSPTPKAPTVGSGAGVGGGGGVSWWLAVAVAAGFCVAGLGVSRLAGRR